MDVITLYKTYNSDDYTLNQLISFNKISNIYYKIGGRVPNFLLNSDKDDCMQKYKNHKLI